MHVVIVPAWLPYVTTAAGVGVVYGQVVGGMGEGKRRGWARQGAGVGRSGLELYEGNLLSPREGRCEL